MAERVTEHREHDLTIVEDLLGVHKGRTVIRSLFVDRRTSASAQFRLVETRRPTADGRSSCYIANMIPGMTILKTASDKNTWVSAR